MEVQQWEEWKSNPSTGNSIKKHGSKTCVQGATSQLKAESGEYGETGWRDKQETAHGGVSQMYVMVRTLHFTLQKIDRENAIVAF